MIPVYQYPNQQGLTTTSVQQHVSTQLAISIPQSVFPLNWQWCQQSQLRLITEKHLHERQKQLRAITKVHWNSGLQMVMHSPKRSRAWKGVERTKIQGCHFILQVKFYTRPTRYRKILLIADSEKNNK